MPKLHLPVLTRNAWALGAEHFAGRDPVLERSSKAVFIDRKSDPLLYRKSPQLPIYLMYFPWMTWKSGFLSRLLR